MYNPVYKTHVGDMAPDFTLPSTGGREVRLYDCKNKKAVVLFFFNHEDPRCLDRLSSLAAGYQELKAADTVVFLVTMVPFAPRSDDQSGAYVAGEPAGTTSPFRP